MEIKYSDNVVLKINITDKMIEDWKDHCEQASIVRGQGKDCNTCSLDVDIGDGYGICELTEVRKELNRLVGITDN